jgi:hypothetical protein
METKNLILFGGGVLVGYMIFNHLKSKETSQRESSPIGLGTGAAPLSQNQGQITSDDNEYYSSPILDNGNVGGQPYVPCNFNDGDIVEATGWLNTTNILGQSDYNFSIVSSETRCMAHTLLSNLDLLDIEKTMTSDMVQYRGKARLKSASLVTDAFKRDENVPIIYT